MKETIDGADLFCGAGGSSTGLFQASRELKIKLNLLAVNHSPIAIATHSANHRSTKHLCEEISRNLDPMDVVPGQKLDILIASPECTHHSIARGGKPMSAQSRASAKHVIRWARAMCPEIIIVENVREWLDWGPLGTNGKPLKRRKGEFFRAWVRGLQRLGYRVEYRILNAADYGDATTRQRLFVMARAGRRPITWPEPSHFPKANLLGMKPWRPAREIIDWSIPGKSIFTRKKPLAPATLARIAAGLQKFGGANAEPFLIILRQHMGARSIDDPLPTVTASGKYVGLAEPFFVPFFGERDGQQPRTHSVDDPLPTVTGQGAGALVEPFLIRNMSHNAPRSIDEPLATLCTGNHTALIEPFIMGHPRTGGPALRSVGNPLATITNNGNFSLVEPFILPQRSDATARDVDRPCPTITTTSRGIAVVEPFVIQTDQTGRPGVIRDVADPLATVVTKQSMALIEPFVLGQQSGSKPRSTTKPLPTVATGGAISLVEPYITKFYGTAKDGQPVTDPLDTITSKDRFGLVEPQANGELMIDIRFRMLQPEELAAAMSFPKGYKFKGTREQRVKQIGNAVGVKIAKALCKSALEMIREARG